MRSAHCMLRLQNATQFVADNLCEDAGLEVPQTVNKCGGNCPQWTPGPWSQCEESRCFTWNTAMQRRDVTCSYINGTETEFSACSEEEKPLTRQECYNDKCKGTWKVGEWSEVSQEIIIIYSLYNDTWYENIRYNRNLQPILQCAAECEEEGIKYRILQCVWFGTKKPAGNECRDQTRPSVMKICKGPPCTSSK